EPGADGDGWERRRGRAGLGRRGLPRPGTPGSLDAADELQDLVAPRVEDDDEVVALELAGLAEPGVGPIPRVLVVEHHGLPEECLELRHRVGALDQVIVTVTRVVRMIREE